MYHAMITEVSGYVKPDVWRQAYLDLHPGAHAIVLATVVTPSTISVGLRRAGFEFRDTLNVQSCGRWTPCFIFRKPVRENTVAAQVLLTGTGALNIDATRVKHANKADFAAHEAMVLALKAKGGSLGNSWKNSSDLTNANDVKEGGRWPGNLVLVHSEKCRHVGEVKKDAPTINRFKDGMKPFGNGAGHQYTSEQQGDANGQETVAVYDCAVGCPAGALDRQTGELHPRGNVNPTNRTTTTGFTRGGSGEPGFANPKGTGGASRFFSQFESSPELLAWLTRLALPEGGVALDPFR